uniref:Chaperonin containing TCP1 subunit 8-like 1 n=1 Tax=Nannospalax galili TaxID=1026970 RepID=A0A8C6S076_NANGA
MAVPPPSQRVQCKVPSALELPQWLEPGLEKISGCLGEEHSCVLWDTDAAQTLATTIWPCYGPYGRRKFLVTAKGETICTGHTAAILRALELEHPAAQFIRELAQSQAEGSGDSTAFVGLLTKALLEQAQHLLWACLPCTQLWEALATATEVLTALPSLAIRSLGPLEDLSWALYSAMNTHTLSNIEHLTKLVAQVCWVSQESDGSFKPERVGVCTLQGGALGDSQILPGLAISGKPCGQMTEVLTNPMATARLSSPEELLQLTAQTKQVNKEVDQLAAMDISVVVVVVSGDVDKNTATHTDSCAIMVILAKSQKEMVYLSEAMGTPLLTQLFPPVEPGRCQKVYRRDLGATVAVVFRWEHESSPSLTLVLRVPTIQGLRGAEQAVYHCIEVFCQLCQDPKLLAGAGAMALAKMLAEKGSQLAGPNGPAFLPFAQALRLLQETLAENAGLATQQVMAKLSASHQDGNFFTGEGTEGLVNVTHSKIWDSLRVKVCALQVVAKVVQQLVTEDEIIVAKKIPMHQLISSPNSKKKKFFGMYK